jgi:hypothetical protein
MMHPTKEDTMKYALLIAEDETFWDNTPREEIGKMMEGYRAFGERNAGAILDGAALQPTATATTVKVRDGERILTDGPFAETREQFGGYYVVDVPGLDEAIELASQIPGAASGCVEVRPVMVFDE